MTNNNLLNATFQCLFPTFCVHCHEILASTQNHLCTKCMAELPWTYWGFNQSNPLYERINRYVEINAATSIFYFYENTVSQSLIHHLKFKGQQEIGLVLADTITSTIINSHFNPDLIIPIPIHKKRLKKRKYNQVQGFSEQLAKNLGCDERNDILIRKVFQKSQTTQNHINRLERLTDSFEVTDEITRYQNIVIVDDVFTSGSTMINCIKKIKLKSHHAKIGVIVMAYVD